jgi:adenine-specific DNA-methyltransferase
VLLDQVDFFRLDANRKLTRERRSDLGQFMTPPATARLMASMFAAGHDEVSILDAGAGVGSLTAALVSELCDRSAKPKKIAATVYEIDSTLAEYLASTLEQCQRACDVAGIAFEAQPIQRDFIDDVARQLRQEMFASPNRYTCAILNPPYKKIHSASDTRLKLRELGIETSNLYTAFLSLAVMVLDSGGELVAITPRSFCNGPYFKPFRKLLLDSIAIRRIHVFESRENAFAEDEVLQENIILHGIKSASRESVRITSSTGPGDDLIAVRDVAYSELVRLGDTEHFIHIVPDQLGASVAEKVARLHWSLNEHQIQASTGRVVDFRATALLRALPAADTVPLIYPLNLEAGFVKWPKQAKKAQAMALVAGAEELLVPKGTYVVVKRFSAKEETRRVVAAVYDSERIDAEFVGFENHLNYFHRNGGGLPSTLAKGLAGFLNSTLLDLYFRQFNGHTQVNATDLRTLRYPTRTQLESIGARIGAEFPSQTELDAIVEEALNLADATGVPDPVQAKKRIEEALNILKELGLPREQQNERSALTLLALLDLRPSLRWTAAKAPLMGITPMMAFFESHYGKRYAPNTRETVRRQTIHQFLDAGVVVINPDKPDRPTNSPYAVYQIESGLLKLLRTYRTPRWEKGLKTYLSSVETLKKKYAQEREMKRIPIQIMEGKMIALSPGGQNILVERIVSEFCQIFTGGGKLVYIGDTDDKFAYFDEPLLKSLGVTIEAHGKMPDVLVFVESKNWLVLIEAVTSHGPVDPKRRGELKTLFAGCKAGLVFVTAFLDRTSMVKYLNDISWETEVWVADAPTHLIHFNGERFLGPSTEE